MDEHCPGRTTALPSGELIFKCNPRQKLTLLDQSCSKVLPTAPLRPTAGQSRLCMHLGERGDSLSANRKQEASFIHNGDLGGKQ